MAVTRWTTIARSNCGRAEPADLLEARVYPADWLDDATGAFQVRARKCAQAETCRADGAPCCWTGVNPMYDPFAD